MPATIVDVGTLSTELVLSERRVTNEFKITEIQENIRERFVRAELELGPFTTETRPNGDVVTFGSSRRGMVVWEGTGYDAVRDTWSNVDLITEVTNKLNNGQ